MKFVSPYSEGGLHFCRSDFASTNESPFTSIGIFTVAPLFFAPNSDKVFVLFLAQQADAP